MEAVAAARGLKTSTIGSHLSLAIEAGIDIDIAALGVTPDIMSTVVRVIHDTTIKSDVSRLSPIKHELELLNLNHVTWDLLKLVISRLKVEHGVTPEGTLEWLRNSFSHIWTTYRVNPPIFLLKTLKTYPLLLHLHQHLASNSFSTLQQISDLH